MIVCICHRVSDRDIHRAVHAGCRHFDDLQDELRVATACGACTVCAQRLFEDQVVACVQSCQGHEVAACQAPLQSVRALAQEAA